MSQAASDELIQRKVLFDHTWTLSIILAAAMTVACWYFGFSQLDIGPVIWTLAGLALAQHLLCGSLSSQASATALQRSALASQLLGTIVLGIAWNLVGGLQQPLFPLFILLPLLSGTTFFSFWRLQILTMTLLLLLASAILLSPDTNSFIEQRYGFGLPATLQLPAWIPRSRIAFADVNTSPDYDLMIMACTALLTVALSTIGRATVTLCSRGSAQLAALNLESDRLQRLNREMITRSPRAELLLLSGSGKIVLSSDKFRQTFDFTADQGDFLLDGISFAYPEVVRRLWLNGGTEIQGASVRGRELVLRLDAVVFGAGTMQMTRLMIESCDEICWRGALDALEQPVFAINSRGEMAFLNRSARLIFGEQAQGLDAAGMFDSRARWWDIAPLDSARRSLARDGRQYLASIRRERIADSIGELTYIHLHERAIHAVAAS